MSQSEIEIYEIYRLSKRLIEKANACCEKDHGDEPLFKEWQQAIKIFDSLGRGYAERYEKEKIMNDLMKEIEDLCLLVDEFAKCDITPNTPIYNFQQGLIENVKRYREKENKEKENEFSS